MKQVIEGKIFYARSYLLCNVKLTNVALEHWHERNIVERVKLDGDTWYCFNDIPLPSREKIEAFEKSVKLQYLADGYNDDYARFFIMVADAGVKPSKREAIARQWALWERIDWLTSETNPDHIPISQAYKLYEELRLPKAIKDRSSFYRKFDIFRRNPLAAMVNGKTGKQSNNCKKTERHCQVLEMIYGLPNKYKAPAITELANEIFRKEGLQELKYETVKKHLADKQLQARTYHSRHGNKAHSDHQKAFIDFEKPAVVGIRAEMDGVKLPFKVWDQAGKKLVRPVMFAIIDAYSGKITGWSLDYTETRWLVLQSFKNQAECGWFPSEIWADNFSGKDTPEFEDVKTKILARGTQIKYCRPGHSQGKPFIERFFGTFQDRFCREYGDWLGMGVRSKDLNNRPNPEALQTYVKKHGYLTMDQLRERISEMLEKYHNTSFKGKPTPNELFANCQDAKTIPVTEAELPYLFWHKTEAKVNRGKLTIEVNKQEYTFPMGVQYNGQKLVVRYEPQDLSEVYVFANDEEETHLAILTQTLAVSREIIKDLGKTYHHNRNERKAEEAKAIALAAPHLTPKQILSEAEDEAEDELLFENFQPTHRSPVAVRPSLKVYVPVEEEED